VELAGKTVLLTGATGGLGRSIATELAGRGATLVLSSRKQAELESLASSLPGDGHRHIVSDLADEGAADRLVADAGEVDVLVANAGLPGTGKLDEYTQDQLVRAIRVNLESPMRMARELIPSMRERGSGHMVFISSLAGKAAQPRSSVYSATKFGLRGFAISLRADLAPEGVGVSVVCPGFIREAGMFHESGRKAPPGLGTSSPEEVATAVRDAIERDRAEVDVAPIAQRLGAAFAHRRPHLAARLAGRQAARHADELARGQVDKR
jgi:short-subunit dehydrogenase